MPKIERLNDVAFNIKADKHIVFSVDPGKTNFACRLEEIFSDGKVNPLIFMRIDLTQFALQEIKKFLDDNYNSLSHATVCIVERQMPINYRMVRLSQFIETYLLCMHPQAAIFEISSKLKVGKEDCIATAYEELRANGDQKSIDLLDEIKKTKVEVNGKKKKIKIDDLCDTICQRKAFFETYKTLKVIPMGPSAFQDKPKKKKGGQKKKKIDLVPLDDVSE